MDRRARFWKPTPVCFFVLWVLGLTTAAQAGEQQDFFLLSLNQSKLNQAAIERLPDVVPTNGKYFIAKQGGKKVYLAFGRVPSQNEARSLGQLHADAEILEGSGSIWIGGPYFFGSLALGATVGASLTTDHTMASAVFNSVLGAVLGFFGAGGAAAAWESKFSQTRWDWMARGISWVWTSRAVKKFHSILNRSQNPLVILQLGSFEPQSPQVIQAFLQKSRFYDQVVEMPRDEFLAEVAYGRFAAPDAVIEGDLSPAMEQESGSFVIRPVHREDGEQGMNLLFSLPHLAPARGDGSTKSPLQSLSPNETLSLIYVRANRVSGPVFTPGRDVAIGYLIWDRLSGRSSIYLPLVKESERRKLAEFIVDTRLSGRNSTSQTVLHMGGRYLELSESALDEMRANFESIKNLQPEAPPCSQQILE